MKLKNLSLQLAALLFVAGCSDTSPDMKGNPRFTEDQIVEKPQLMVFSPKVDILFVIDNSGSMDEVQDNLRRNAYVFADELSKVSVLDYHIGVVTTDMDTYSCSRSRDCGVLRGIPAYVDPQTPDVVRNLSERMVVGVNGSATEQMFSPVIAALSPPLENTVNSGFFRSDAFIAIIFVTDAKDQSRYKASDLYQFLLQKKGTSEKILGYGVIRTVANERTCKTAEDLDGKLEEFLAMVANGTKKQENILGLCEADYGTKLAEFAKDILRRTAGRVPLSRLPRVETIRVTFGNQEIPNSPTEGWIYEPSTNSIVFAEGIAWNDQGPGAGLSIDFEAIDLE